MTVEPTKLNLPQSQPPAKQPEVATPAPTKLKLAPSTPKPQQEAPAATSLHIGNNSSSVTDSRLVDEFKQQYGALYQKDAMNIDLLLRQLMPLKLDVIVNWGDQSLQHLRSASLDVTSLVQAMSLTIAAKSVQKALDVMQPQTGFFNKMFNKVSPLDFVPAITAAQTTMADLLPKSEKYMQNVQRVNDDVVNRLAVLSVIAQYVGAIPDNALDMAFASRRSIFQQAAQQCQFSLQQVKTARDTIVQYKLSTDNFLNITLPAWKSTQGS